MKKLSFFLLFLAGAAAASAQEAGNNNSSQQVPDNPNAPVMAFEKDVHDYGTIKQGADGNCEFKFKNTGKEPLIISNATGSCGCTVPDWPKQPIKPGETAVIKVHYDTKRVGMISKTVTVVSNAKNSPKVLSIKGMVEAEPEEVLTPFKPVENGATPVITPGKK